MRTVIYLLLFLIVISCETTNKNIDSFYTSKSFGDIRILPLFKPLRLSYNEDNKTWEIVFPLDYKQRMLIDSLYHIGVDNHLIYGKIFETVEYSEVFKHNDTVHLDKHNTRYGGKKLNNGDVRIFIWDTLNNTFISPERYFIINPKDSTIEAFFKKDEYLEYLKARNVIPHLQNIDSLATVFLKTNILPWFPHDVKQQLEK